MTLVFDQRDNLKDQPGLHALIVGVSAYPHLPGGTGRQASNNFGMQQLSSAALTAYKIYRWLVERQKKLAAPLATCQLLLSPSLNELAVEPSLNGLADPCTLDNFLTAARDWRTNASTHKDNVTFFYFTGHGVQRSKGDSVLLLEDFADGIGGTLTKAVNMQNISNGMTRATSRPNMARTQLYFVDACRVLPSKFRDFERMETTSVWDVELAGRDDRQAPIFYAAVPGSKAYALPVDQTLFSKALLNCLNGGAGKPPEQDGQEEWCVSYYSLNDALREYIDELNQAKNADQDFIVDAYGSDAIIHFLDEPPLVEIVLEVEPVKALTFAQVKVINDQDELAWNLPAPLSPHPYRDRWPAGFYRIGAEIDPPHPDFVNSQLKGCLVKPPRFKRKVRVS